MFSMNLYCIVFFISHICEGVPMCMGAWVYVCMCVCIYTFVPNTQVNLIYTRN